MRRKEAKKKKVLRKIMLDDLDLYNGISPSELENGKGHRIYLNYPWISSEVRVREGGVINRHGEKTFGGIPKTLCLEMRVKKAGKILDGHAQLGPVDYSQKYIYSYIWKSSKIGRPAKD